jgi:two-component system OmpR family sensor kinase
MSLRARLLTGVLALAAVGMVVLAFVVYSQLSHYLIQRVDADLDRATDTLVAEAGRGLGRVPRGGPNGFAQNRTFTQIVDSTGASLLEYPATSGGAPLPPPDLSTMPPAGDPGTQHLFTANAVSTSLRYRVESTDAVNGRVILASPLNDVDATLSRLVKVEIVATLAVLGALGGLVIVVVRRGLRPLDDVVDAAGGVAAGDLSHRVPVAHPNTEVGRLGVAFNTMVDRIQDSFAERDASEEQLRRFLADASHELRTPLTSIRGYAELFRRGAAEDPEQLALAMRRIEDEAARMGVLVDDLLLLARLDQGRPLEHRPVDLVALVNDAVSDARAVEPDRPISVSLDTKGPVVVPGDDARLHQVVANLLTNARVHTPSETPVAVHVGMNDDTAVIEVADRGPGMTAAEVAHVFEPFYRADASRSRRQGGAGLGLAIVAAVVSAHGGHVDVKSAPGAGATFRVRLPRNLLHRPENMPAPLPTYS